MVPGVAVSLRLFRERALIQEAHALHATPPWKGKNHLPSHPRCLPFGLTNVHADINVRNQVASTRVFDLLPLGESVHTTEDDVACSQELWSLLPTACYGTHHGGPAHVANDPLRDLDFQALRSDIGLGCPNKSVEIRFLNPLVVKEHVVDKSKVRQLLHDVRAATPKPDDSYAGIRYEFLRLRTQETLSLKATN